MHSGASLKLFVFILSVALLMACGNQNNADKTVAGQGTSAGDSLGKKSAIAPGNCEKLYGAALYHDSLLQTHLEPDKNAANSAIKAFIDFAYYCEADSMAPVYLIKTAQVSRAINNPAQAKSALTQCIDNYRSFKDRPAAMFLLAQLYDDDIYLNNEAEAALVYRQIIEEYPESVWALNAKAALVYLGKSDKEMIKEFSKKNK